MLKKIREKNIILMLPNLKSNDYYKILGIDKKATNNDIKKAYHKLAMKYHPDKNNNSIVAANAFKKINEAYNVLSDKVKRSNYDLGIDDKNQIKFNFNGMPNQNTNDIFSEIFGNRFQKFFQQQTSNFRYESLNSIDAYTIPKGKQVIINGLKTSSEYNGQRGVVVKYDVFKSRYLISLMNYTNLHIKSCNLQQVHTVIIRNLTKRVLLNQSTGQMIGFNKSNKRCQVIINKEHLALKPSNIRFKVGSIVKVYDLKKRYYLNNSLVKIIKYDGNFYVVKTYSGKLLKINCSNIIG